MISQSQSLCTMHGNQRQFVWGCITSVNAMNWLVLQHIATPVLGFCILAIRRGHVEVMVQRLGSDCRDKTFLRREGLRRGTLAFIRRTCNCSFCRERNGYSIEEANSWIRCPPTHTLMFPSTTPLQFSAEVSPQDIELLCTSFVRGLRVCILSMLKQIRIE